MMTGADATLQAYGAVDPMGMAGPSLGKTDDFLDRYVAKHKAKQAQQNMQGWGGVGYR